jgi:uncharacterized protein
MTDVESPTVQAEGRERLPDQLRGIALFGIVLVNTPFLAINSSGFTEASTATWPDRITAFVVVALAQGKFYLLFSFLFGYSLTLMLRRRTGDGLRRFRRRLGGLAVLGVGHAALFFVGDILLSYALLGTILLWFAGRSDRAAIRAAAVGYVAAVAVLLLVLDADSGGGSGDGFAPAALDVALRGSFLDAAQGRIAALPSVLVVLAVLNWALIVVMFLLGLVAGRRGVLAHPERFRPLWRRLLVLAAAIGLPGGLVSAWLSLGPDAGPRHQAVGLLIGFGTAPMLSAGYVALAALGTGSRLLALAEPAGRMSLTGYLGESILLSAIFCGWGLGWYGRLGALACAGIALAVWLALEVFAKVWLTRYRYGPFEWLLRAWSYRALPAMRKTSTQA